MFPGDLQVMNLIVRDMDTPEHCTTPQDEVPQSLAFTVTFGEAKKRHFQRHSRNLSLPVVKVYDNNVSTYFGDFFKFLFHNILKKFQLALSPINYVS